MVIVWRLKRLNKTSVSISTNALLWLYEARGIVELRCLNNVFPYTVPHLKIGKSINNERRNGDCTYFIYVLFISFSSLSV